MLVGLTYQFIRFIADLMVVRARSDAELARSSPLIHEYDRAAA